MSDLDARVASLLTVGFGGRVVDPDLDGLLARGVGGAVLFSRNVGAAREVRELTVELKRRARGPLFVAVDQEGGKVARLREGFTRLPPLRALGERNDPALSRDYGRLVGRELRAVGVDLDFAPVLDVDTNPENPVIGERSLGSDPTRVALHGVAFAEGLMSEGVAACGKHFPGHGDTRSDSHLELPRLPHTMERLEEVELVPFRAAARAGFPAIMTAHVVFEALDPTRPATLSPAVVGGLLRRTIGFSGVVFSDDLEMRAIADHYAIEEVVVGGLEAGVSAFLVCHDTALAHRAIDAAAAAVRRGVLPEARIHEAADRVAALARRFAGPPADEPALSRLASEEHRALVRRVEGEERGAA